ncbi:helix-turn-helix domain-containing protein [Paramuribaculum intestinale]|uniref:helix-turn-helix domain-containing protein n=1 Tax=Paramuribaculum intestinale TaxID=2094151 RepID=UPI0025A96DD7|nr:helix-turn-helix transcriptional regulator [Paramuribaculum intestinale]
MADEELLSRVESFDESFFSAHIALEEHPEPGVTTVVAWLYSDPGSELTIVPFVIPDNEEWMFTPRDWQSFKFNALALYKDLGACIQATEWRVNNTDTPGFIVNGLPRLLNDAPVQLKIVARKKLGEDIKAARLAKGLTLKDLDALTGIPYSRLSRIEGGRDNPTFDGLVRLAVTLNTTFVIGGY